jgi:two-component system, chemotaxis family, chemotaxis protein CheY
LAQSQQTLLVVDDDRDIREALQDVLEGAGYHVHLAGDGREALACLHGGCCPDLILLDLMMPRMNGFEFRDVQRREEPLCHIPVLLASADPELPRAARALGVAGYLRKPLDLDDLLGAVSSLCAPAGSLMGAGLQPPDRAGVTWRAAH